MSSIKNIGNRVTLLERKVNVGNYGGINVAGGLLQVDASNNKITTTSSQISFGSNAGVNQGTSAVAIGAQAGSIRQMSGAIAIGYQAGLLDQSSNAIAIGYQTASTNQGIDAIAIGRRAGESYQSKEAIAIGNQAGRNTQGIGSIAIGVLSGRSNQNLQSVAIGQESGKDGQGTFSIAIGAFAGQTSQPPNSIVLNASGSTLSGATQSAFFVRPIRSVNAATTGSLIYNPSSYEITHDSTKTFVINHPTQDDKYLVHACLEGPEAGVYYRGEGEITNGESVEITLPEYTKNFYNFTVQITPINSRNLYGVSRVVDGKFKVLGDNGEFFWIAHGARKEIQVEPSKSDVLVKGDGPYTYISK